MSQHNDGTVKAAKIILGGVGSHPMEAEASETALIGRKLTEDRVREAAEAAFRPAKPLDNTDFHMFLAKGNDTVLRRRCAEGSGRSAGEFTTPVSRTFTIS